VADLEAEQVTGEVQSGPVTAEERTAPAVDVGDLGHDRPAWSQPGEHVAVVAEPGVGEAIASSYVGGASDPSLATA
jgi:hypothetical protein